MMSNTAYCQSCSMPLDAEELKGTEKDGSKSNEYCIYCYKNGAFTDPEVTLDKMKTNIKSQMEKLKLPATVTDLSINILPSLKRWKTQSEKYN